MRTTAEQYVCLYEAGDREPCLQRVLRTAVMRTAISNSKHDARSIAFSPVSEAYITEGLTRVAEIEEEKGLTADRLQPSHTQRPERGRANQQKTEVYVKKDQPGR